MAHDVNWRIIKDDGTLPHFTRASQNIAAMVALFRGLPEPVTPEDRRSHRDLHMLLETSLSWRRELDASQRAPLG